MGKVGIKLSTKLKPSLSVSGGGRGGSKGKGKKKVEEKEEPAGPVGGVRGCGQPLLELVVEEEGQLWMRANLTLARLTLSC